MIPGLHTIAHPAPADVAELRIPAEPRLLGMFEGYGGLTQGILAILGGQLSAYAEIDPSSIALIEQHYPGIPNLGDVTQVDYAALRGTIDGIAAGFPCQDVSHAGLGKGIQTGTRSGLWYEVARAIAEIGPAFVLIENVKGLRSAPAGMKTMPDGQEMDDDFDEETAAGDRELDAWDLGGSGGSDRPVLRALGAVLLDLAELGYRATWGSFRASDVGAPHRRERVFILAVPD